MHILFLGHHNVGSKMTLYSRNSSANKNEHYISCQCNLPCADKSVKFNNTTAKSSMSAKPGSYLKTFYHSALKKSLGKYLSQPFFAINLKNVKNCHVQH